MTTETLTTATEREFKTYDADGNYLWYFKAETPEEAVRVARQRYPGAVRAEELEPMKTAAVTGPSCWECGGEVRHSRCQRCGELSIDDDPSIESGFGEIYGGSY